MYIDIGTKWLHAQTTHKLIDLFNTCQKCGHAGVLLWPTKTEISAASIDMELECRELGVVRD